MDKKDTKLIALDWYKQKHETLVNYFIFIFDGDCDRIANFSGLLGKVRSQLTSLDLLGNKVK